LSRPVCTTAKFRLCQKGLPVAPFTTKHSSQYAGGTRLFSSQSCDCPDRTMALVPGGEGAPCLGGLRSRGCQKPPVKDKPSEADAHII